MSNILTNLDLAVCVGGILTVMIAFLFGILWAPATATGAFACIIGYVVLNVVLQVVFNGFATLPFVKYVDPANFSALPDALVYGLAEAPVNFMHRIGLATVGAVGILIVVSRFTSSERSAEKEKLVWWHHRASQPQREKLPAWKDDRLWAALLVATGVGLCVYFA